MAASQIGAPVTAEENARITVFLESLTGELPRVTYPILPTAVGPAPPP
jgi:cytochrome c peroxidase